MRYPPHPADQRPDSHRHADPQADQVPDAEERERQEEVEARDSALAHAEITGDIAGEDARRRDQRESSGDHRAPYQRRETRAAFLEALALRAAATLEHLGAGDTLRIGQIRVRDERTPQGNRVADTENAAEDTDGA